jgi:hypothetical protein
VGKLFQARAVSGSVFGDANGPVTNLFLYVVGPPASTDLFVDDVELAPLDSLAIENLLANPAFESGTTGWQARGPATVLPSSLAHSGTNAVVVTNRAAPWQGVEQNLTDRLEPGRTYFFSPWVRTDRATNDTVKLSMERRETTATNFTVIASTLAASNGWTWLSGYHTPPATGTVTALKFYVEGPAPGVVLFVDDPTPRR